MGPRCRPGAIPCFGRGLRHSSVLANFRIANARNAGPGRPLGRRGCTSSWTGESTAAWWLKAGAVAAATTGLMFISSASASEVPAQMPPTSVHSAAVDQWAGLVAGAGSRTGLPAIWLHDLMRMESNGKPLAVSSKGAIGLMQLMPATYAMLRVPLGLGANPFDPRDNVLAGAMYLRLLVDRYGWPGALAAYNAGPARLDSFLAHGRALPAETIAYVWRFAPEHAGSFGGSVAARSPTPPQAALNTRPNASPARSPETMFAGVASTPSTAPMSAEEAVANRRKTAASWRESSLFAPISGSQARP